MHLNKISPHFSIIIATNKRASVLKEALTSILSQSYRYLDVIVAHTGINDGTYECVQKLANTTIPIHYLACKNVGAASQRNAALSEVKGDWIFFLDDDVILQPNFFDEIVAVLKLRPEAGGISGKISNQYSTPLRMPIRFLLWMAGGGFSADVNGKIRGPIINFLPYQFGNDIDEIDWMPTCACGYKREILVKFGGFSDFFVDYSLGEDIFLSMKVKLEYPILLARKAVLFHNYLGGTNAKQAYIIGKMQLFNRMFILKEITRNASFVNLIRLLFWNISNSILNFIRGHKSVIILWNSWRGYLVGFINSFKII